MTPIYRFTDYLQVSIYKFNTTPITDSVCGRTVFPKETMAVGMHIFPSPPPPLTPLSTSLLLPRTFFSSLRKPPPSLNPRWHPLDQNAPARQKTPTLQASPDLVFRYPPCREASKDKLISHYPMMDQLNVLPVPWAQPFDLPLLHHNKVIVNRMAENLG